MCVLLNFCVFVCVLLHVGTYVCMYWQASLHIYTYFRCLLVGRSGTKEDSVKSAEWMREDERRICHHNFFFFLNQVWLKVYLFKYEMFVLWGILLSDDDD